VANGENGHHVGLSTSQEGNTSGSTHNSKVPLTIFFAPTFFCSNIFSNVTGMWCVLTQYVLLSTSVVARNIEGHKPPPDPRPCYNPYNVESSKATTLSVIGTWT
jgi:hypothetical protein